jgi:hypothetical protein
MIRHQIAEYFRPLAEPWFWAVVVVAGIAGYAFGAKPPQVSARPPQIAVTEPADTGGDMPPHAAPAGQEWRRYEGLPWVLYPIDPAPAVAETRPFADSRPAAFTPDTGARRVDGPLPSSPDRARLGAPTFINAPVGILGTTNCAGFG